MLPSFRILRRFFWGGRAPYLTDDTRKGASLAEGIAHHNGDRRGQRNAALTKPLVGDVGKVNLGEYFSEATR